MCNKFLFDFFTSHFKQEEEALLNEIELTGQAYDEMQEQNDRLLQQLSSKDDANFKLITDRINASQKEALLSAQINELEKQVIHCASIINLINLLK